jgi:glycosyltransferase involved in cell wall biosynthesis
MLVERHELSARVRFLGTVRDTATLLAAADLFVFPSLIEAFPLALLEALAAGVPVVASDIPPVREIVAGSNDAVLVPPANPRALRDALHQALSRSATGLQTHRPVTEGLGRFSIDRTVAEYAALYENLLAQPQRRGVA